MRALARLLAGLLLLVGGYLLLAGGCSDPDQPATEAGPQPTILLAQAQFEQTIDEKTGKPKTETLPARLVILQKSGDQWKREVLQDPESNVFHKAVIFKDPAAAGQPTGILTIAANAATVKLWHRTSDGWSADTLWETTFGGKQNRLRDFEIGDVTGDGDPDIAIATHDQGVVAVLSRSGDGWQATELDRKKKTFVHEIELGDLDGDGVREIYATPSRPNKFDGTPQPGEIVVYRHTSGGFERGVVEEFPLRHVKEILITDIDGSGRPVLLASVEAELGRRADAPPEASQTLIKRYRLEAGQFVGETVCTLPDSLCRFLNAGDVDGDGKAELIASTHKRGIWLARPGPDKWDVKLIDHDSSGFEHATALADLDGDGVQEIYVAADDQKQLRRYHWTGSDWQREAISPIEEQKITFGVYVGKQ